MKQHFPSFSELDLFFRDPIFGTTQQSFPPYNIAQSKDGNTVKITIAVAGFKKEDVSIDIVENKLTVAGALGTAEDTSDWDIQHKGIAGRSFKLQWHKNPNFEVKGAQLKDGLLTIVLEKVAGFAQKVPISDELEMLVANQTQQLLTE